MSSFNLTILLLPYYCSNTLAYYSTKPVREKAES